MQYGWIWTPLIPDSPNRTSCQIARLRSEKRRKCDVERFIYEKTDPVACVELDDVER